MFLLWWWHHHHHQRGRLFDQHCNHRKTHWLHFCICSCSRSHHRVVHTVDATECRPHLSLPSNICCFLLLRWKRCVCNNAVKVLGLQTVVQKTQNDLVRPDSYQKESKETFWTESMGNTLSSAQRKTIGGNYRLRPVRHDWEPETLVVIEKQLSGSCRNSRNTCSDTIKKWRPPKFPGE